MYFVAWVKTEAPLVTDPLQGGAQSCHFTLTEMCCFTVYFTICRLNSQLNLRTVPKKLILEFQNCASYKCQEDTEDRGQAIICSVSGAGRALNDVTEQSTEESKHELPSPSCSLLKPGASVQCWIVRLLDLWVSFLHLTSNCKWLMTHLIQMSLSQARGRMNQGSFRTLFHQRGSRRQQREQRPVGLQTGQGKLSTHDPTEAEAAARKPKPSQTPCSSCTFLWSEQMLRARNHWTIFLRWATKQNMLIRNKVN